MNKELCGKSILDEVIDKLKEKFELSEEEQKYLLDQLSDFAETK